MLVFTSVFYQIIIARYRPTLMNAFKTTNGGKRRVNKSKQKQRKRTRTKRRGATKWQKKNDRLSVKPAYIIIHTLSIFVCFLSGYTFNRVEINVQSGMFVVYTLLS